jgi:outer membrane receptor protein involved in Fe transport
MGLRYEYSNYDLSGFEKTDIVNRHYGNLFPVISLAHAFNERNAVTLSYNRRIARPSYSQLAPYTYIINENISFTGNAALQPSISNNITAGYSHKKYALTISFGKQDNAIAGFQAKIDTGAGKVFITARNFDQQLLTGLITVPVVVNTWWAMQYNVTGVWQQVTIPGNKPEKKDRTHININAMQSFRLPKNYSVELTGFYQSSLLSGSNVQKAYGSLDAGIRKKLPGRKGTITFSAGNILNTQDMVIDMKYPALNQATHLHIRFVQRTFRLTWTCNFGNDKLKAKRERVTGADDGKGRVE